MNRTSTLRIVTSIVFAGGFGIVAMAGRASADPPRPPQPPPEAFGACDGKARGDACSVQIHDHAMQGVCDAPPHESRLACRPNQPPPPPSAEP
jgi:hypothetical protein